MSTLADARRDLKDQLELHAAFNAVALEQQQEAVITAKGLIEADTYARIREYVTAYQVEEKDAAERVEQQRREAAKKAGLPYMPPTEEKD